MMWSTGTATAIETCSIGSSTCSIRMMHIHHITTVVGIQDIHASKEHGTLLLLCSICLISIFRIFHNTTTNGSSIVLHCSSSIAMIVMVATTSTTRIEMIRLCGIRWQERGCSMMQVDVWGGVMMILPSTRHTIRIHIQSVVQVHVHIHRRNRSRISLCLGR